MDTQAGVEACLGEVSGGGLWAGVEVCSPGCWRWGLAGGWGGYRQPWGGTSRGEEGLQARRPSLSWGCLPTSDSRLPQPGCFSHMKPFPADFRPLGNEGS